MSLIQRQCSPALSPSDGAREKAQCSACHSLIQWQWASRILSGAIQPLLADWSERYGYQPVLLESFVESPRFKGTSYKAANWICMGQTQGRGKLEKQYRQACALKQIWLYPLHPHFRKILCA